MRTLVLATTLVLAAAWTVSGANAANPAAGKAIYDANCAACHGPDGVATLQGAPNFAKRERLDKPDAQLVNSIRNGLNIMPAWKGQISDSDMASALAYIRTLAH